MNNIRKALLFFKEPKIIIRKILHKLPNGKIKNTILRFPTSKTILQELEQLKIKTDDKEIFIFPLPSCPWGYMFQRPQQLALSLARKGYPVIYMVDTSFPHCPDWDIRSLVEIDNNLYLYNDGLGGQLLHTYCANKHVIVWQYWPHQTRFVNMLSEQCSVSTIYDCIDHLSTFDSYYGIEREFYKSLENAEIVLATSKEIFNELRNIRSDCFLVPNGVRIEDFEVIGLKKFKLPDPIRLEAKIIVGYYGAVAEWFDFEMVDYIAKANLNWAFVIVGEVYPEVTKKAKKLKENNNVVMLPRIPYSDIPCLLSVFDIAMLPFIINDITLSTSPVKVFEYMAGKKITVSSCLPEIMGLPGVLVARSAEEFNQKLHEAVILKDNMQIQKQLLQEARGNTWDKRSETVLSLLKKRL